MLNIRNSLTQHVLTALYEIIIDRTTDPPTNQLMMTNRRKEGVIKKITLPLKGQTDEKLNFYG